jgi:hypothetical protein
MRAGLDVLAARRGARADMSLTVWIAVIIWVVLLAAVVVLCLAARRLDDEISEEEARDRAEFPPPAESEPSPSDESGRDQSSPTDSGHSPSSPTQRRRRRA